MSHFSGEHALEYALLWVFDPTVDLADYPEVDPAEIAVLTYGALAVVSAMHEVDGRVSLDIYVDEEPDLRATPLGLGDGHIELLSGRLAVADSPSLEIRDEFDVPKGRYDVAVYGDSLAFSQYVVLHLSLHGGARARG